MTRAGWIDCTAGVSGDMLLTALDDVGARPLDVVDLLQPVLGPMNVSTDDVKRAGLRARALRAELPAGQPARSLADVETLLGSLTLPAAVADRTLAVFRRLARAEGRVHDIDEAQVHFHEIGAADTLLDVIGVCLGFDRLGLDRLTVSPVGLGGGRTDTAHGVIPIPGPAVLALLADSGLIGVGGPIDLELATPTGVALVAELADESGPMAAMTIESIGHGAGSRDTQRLPNIVRLVVGEATSAPGADDGWLMLEANVDDLDPRLWPGVIDRILAAGAIDAWLTPILMKKGRAAHTINALASTAASDSVVRTLFMESSTIGVRTIPVGKQALERRWIEVDIAGQSIRVKLAILDGEVVNVSPEFDEVAAAAATLGRPVKAVLAAAAAAAHDQL